VSSKDTPVGGEEPALAFIREKISRLLRTIDRSFVERETHIRVAIIAPRSARAPQTSGRFSCER